MHSGLHAAIDYLGAATLVLMVVPLLLALTLDKSVNGWTSPLILGLFAPSLIGLALFILVELRAAGPIIPLKLFRNRSFTLINLASPMVGASMFAAVLFLSLYLVNVLDVSATAAGSSLIPLMGGMVTSSIVASQIVQRLGRYKLLMLGGMLVAAAGFWWLTTLNVDSTLNEVRDNDQATIQALLDSPQTPAELKQMLRAGIPVAAREQALAKLNAGLDAAEANALANGQQLGRELSAGIKNAFTDSVIQIYWYAIPLVLLAFVITLFMPELPLRRSNGPAPAVAID